MSWFTPSRPWQSGPWSLDLRGDEIADVSYEGRRVLRSIRAVVRDRNWDTAPLIVDRVRETDATLGLHVRSVALGSTFRGVLRVEARASGLLVVLDLESESDYPTNRTGLVVLQPPEVAGAPLAVTHSDGSVERTTFPERISPHQPARDIAALAWAAQGLEASVVFQGDTFEMEDQRNWTDASFKTYSRPLSLPFPYVVPAGGRVRQSITVRAHAATERRDGKDASPARIALIEAGGFPAIGLGAASAPDPAPSAPPLGAFVLVELDLASPNWRAALARAAAAGLPLDVRFTLDAARPEALIEGAAALAGHQVIRVAAFHQVSDARHVSDREAVDDLRAAIARADVAADVLGGSRSHFTELNRERERIPAELDGVTVALTPLFHVDDTEQLVESIAMQRLVVEHALALAGDRPLHIGPIALRPRFNDVATGPQPAPLRADLLEGYGAEFTGAADDRQSAPELAAWTIASAAALAMPGVASLAYFEEWGPRGVRTTRGDHLPVAAALDALAGLTGDRLLHGDSPDGELWALGATDGATSRVLVANIGRAERTLVVETPHGEVETSLAPGSYAALTT